MLYLYYIIKKETTIRNFIVSNILPEVHLFKQILQMAIDTWLASMLCLIIIKSLFLILAQHMNTVFIIILCKKNRLFIIFKNLLFFNIFLY